MDLEVRFVTEADRDDLARLWYDVLVEEQGRFTQFADRERRMLRDVPPAVPVQRVLAVREDGRLVGSLQLICGMDGPFPDVYEEWVSISRFLQAAGPDRVVLLTHFMVAKDRRGGPAALAMMAKALEFAIERRIDVAVCESEPHLLPYYRRVGFRPYRPMYSDPNYPVILPLVLLAADRSHLLRIGSPLAGMLPDGFPTEVEPALLEIVAAQENAFSTDPADVSINDLGRLLTMPAPPSVFEGLSEDERTRLLERSYLISFSPGDVLTRTGHDAKSLFVIVDGVVEIQRDGRTVGFGAPGDLVGEMAFLLDTPRTADVHVRAPGRALILSERTVGTLVGAEPALAAKVLLNVSRLLARKVLEHVP